MDKVNYWLGSLSPMIATVFIVVKMELWPNAYEAETLGGMVRGLIGLVFVLYSMYLSSWVSERLERTEGVSKE